MKSSIVRLLFVFAIVALPLAGYAQEASLIGTVTDASGGVLPGVTITATHEASGNKFLAVTDERGTYRIPARVGTYSLTVELSGFTTLTQTGLNLLVGQVATVNFQMKPASVQESVTVTGEAPLVDVTQSNLASNVDPRQLSELPVNGRNFVDLTMLAPGSRANAITEAPVSRNSNNAGFQLNVDGQQVTQMVAFDFGQPRFSRDAIEEFQLISNQFDATQGRSVGMQVNAVTKSGSNLNAGTASGYFRNDSFNAKDFIQQRVLPYSDKQFVATFGGPIRKDKIHFFADYEIEREAQDFTYSSPFPAFNVDQTGTRKERKGIARLDFQFSPATRLSFRVNDYDNNFPYEPRVSGGATRHPAGSETVERYANELFGTLTHVRNRSVNELKLGYVNMWWFRNGVAGSGATIDTPKGPGFGPKTITLTGYTIGSTNLPALNHPKSYSFRDDYSRSFNRHGQHDLKVGGEYIYDPFTITIAFTAFGSLDAQGGAVPANIQSLFPVWNDVRTWNLAPLSPISRQYSVGVAPGQNFTKLTKRNDFGGWVQDDWKIASRLTLNLGVRYDVQANALAENVKFLPFMPGDGKHDMNNIAPRLGFALSANDRTVIRGGFGQFYGEVPANLWAYANNRSAQATAAVLYDGRADFATNPFNGPAPTYEQVIANSCNTNGNRAGCYRQDLSGLASPNMVMPYSYQTSIGMQRQLNDTTSVQADYVYTASRREYSGVNLNLTYNPATGANYPFTDLTRRPYPEFGTISMSVSDGYANTHALQTAFTKRLGNRWQASGTYTFSGLWDAGQPAYSGTAKVPFTVAKDLTNEYSLATTDQRHRAVFNGIWQAGYGFQLSGLYFLRLRRALQHQLRRRSAQRRHRWHRPAAPGRDDRSAQQLRRAADPPRGHAPDAPLQLRGPQKRRCAPRNIQPVQPRQLRRVHDVGEQRAVRKACGQPQYCLSAAHDAAGVQSCVLGGGTV